MGHACESSACVRTLRSALHARTETHDDQRPDDGDGRADEVSCVRTLGFHDPQPQQGGRDINPAVGGVRASGERRVGPRQRHGKRNQAGHSEERDERRRASPEPGPKCEASGDLEHRRRCEYRDVGRHAAIYRIMCPGVMNMKTTRREFLTAAAVTPLLSPIILSPIMLGAQDKSGRRAPVLGSGAYTYEAIHDWGTLPSHIKWGNTHGVVEDSQGNIYVHHTVHATTDSADSMVVFDREGKFIRSWGREFKGVAHGLHLRREGTDEFLYLTVNAANPRLSPQPEMQAVVVKATLKGEIVWKIQGPPDVDAYKTPNADGTAKRYNPTNVAIAPNGDLYVGDGYGSYYVNHHNRKAESSRTFRRDGTGPRPPGRPHRILGATRPPRPVLGEDPAGRPPCPDPETTP